MTLQSNSRDSNTRNSNFGVSLEVATRGNRPPPVSLVAGNGSAGLALAIDPENHVARSNTFILFNIPQGTFVSSNAEATVTLEAKLQDGQDLPGWLNFEASTGVFSGTPPEDFEGRLALRVVARDSAGSEAEALFELVVTDDAAEEVQGVQPVEGELDDGEQAEPATEEQQEPNANVQQAVPAEQAAVKPAANSLALAGHAGLQVQLAQVAGSSVLTSAMNLLDELAFDEV